LTTDGWPSTTLTSSSKAVVHEGLKAKNKLYVSYVPQTTAGYTTRDFLKSGGIMTVLFMCNATIFIYLSI
jgi:hypothetical protein